MPLLTHFVYPPVLVLVCEIWCDVSYAAAHQPFILVPGANHAQTSNGVPNYARGDIPATAEYGATTEQLGKAVASFLTSHQAAQKSERQAAADELLVMVRRTAEMLGPYFMASGTPWVSITLCGRCCCS